MKFAIPLGVNPVTALEAKAKKLSKTREHLVLTKTDEPIVSAALAASVREIDKQLDAISKILARPELLLIGLEHDFLRGI